MRNNQNLPNRQINSNNVKGRQIPPTSPVYNNHRSRTPNRSSRCPRNKSNKSYNNNSRYSSSSYSNKRLYSNNRSYRNISRSPCHSRSLYKRNRSSNIYNNKNNGSRYNSNDRNRHQSN